MKKVLYILPILCTLLASMDAKSNPAPVPEIEEFDLRTYFPDNYGLQDVVFEIRSPQLLEALKKDEGLGEIIDVYFKVSWMRPSTFLVTVEGVPRGHENLRESLKQSIRPILELVFPEKLGGKVRSYKLAREKKGGETVIKGVDESGTRAVTELEMSFDAKNRLKEIKSLSIMGPSAASFDYSVKSWGNNKWVLDKMTTRIGRPGNEAVTTYALDYSSVKGVGLPDTIKVSAKMVAGKQESKETKTEYLFSKYEVNTGKASKTIQGK
jgi:hypothetical protein